MQVQPEKMIEQDLSSKDMNLSSSEPSQVQDKALDKKQKKKQKKKLKKQNAR